MKSKHVILTQKQASILAFLMACRMPPTIRELMDQFGIKSPNGVRGHLLAMRKNGLVTWQERSARTLRATRRWIPADKL